VLARLPTTQVLEAYPFIWGLLQELCETDPIQPISRTDLLTSLLSGRRQAWVTDGAAAITEIQGRVGAVLWVAGEALDYVGEFTCQFEKYARENACTSIETCGRLGWERLLKPLNYKITRVVLRKEL
jgi:hypothetical protein